MPLHSTERGKLVEALFDCDCMKTAQSRNSVLRDLPDEIQQRFTGGGTAKQDIDDLVRICSQFPNGLEALLQRVLFFEGKSFAWMRLEQVAREVLGNQPEAPVAATPTPDSASANQSAKEPVKIFFSYSHKDESLREEMVKHLAILKRQGLIAPWHDRDIEAGTEWSREIQQHLDEAQIILLLVSHNFIASDFCWDNEMGQALKRHDAGTAVVIPILLSPCDWRGAPFGKVQGLPKDLKPVTTWANQDEAFTNIAAGIRRAVERLQ